MKGEQRVLAGGPEISKSLMNRSVGFKCAGSIMTPKAWNKLEQHSRQEQITCGGGGEETPPHWVWAQTASRSSTHTLGTCKHRQA